MEVFLWIFIAALCIISACLVKKAGDAAKGDACFSFLKESRSMLLLVLLLWLTAALLIYFFMTESVNIPMSNRFYLLALTALNLVLGFYTLIFMINRKIFATEDGITEINAFGRKKYIPWDKVMKICPPSYSHLSVIFIGEDGTKISASGAKKNRRDFLLKSSKKLSGEPAKFLRMILEEAVKKNRF